ncbi:MAG: hypothetical protein ABJF89_08845 [Parasphingorhabdus sp.]|uniref:hypothetical protein n=1 Tax=Parasphingorhabdus sp. TaxID=2709688 RepID=UPI0032659DCC
MEDSKSKQIVRYSPNSPAVLFHQMRADLQNRWDQSKMVGLVRDWLRPPRKKASIRNSSKFRRRPANIIIPDANDPFMLMAKSDPMSNLLAENHRLKNLINELVREDPNNKHHAFRN